MKIVRPMAMSDATLTSSNINEDDESEYNAETTYSQGALVMITTAGVHKIYESLQGSNTGQDPVADSATATPTWWSLVGSTNRWCMFDASVQSQSEHADSIAVEIAAAGRVDSVCLFNLSATSVRITMTDAIDGVVYDQTIQLTSSSGVTDWYSYFFEPISFMGELSVTDMPPYANAAITITINNPGSTAKCGECVLGQSKTFGDLVFGASLGIQDYSVKEQDDFGNFTILERAYSRQADFEIWVDSSFVDELMTLLSAVRATPIVYIGSDNYRSTMVYGFFKDFSVVISYPEKSVCNLQLEGLT